jgi:hypothetical protein
VQVTFYSTQSVGTPATPGTPPSPAVQLLDPDEAAQTLATQAATNNTALFVTSPELVSSTYSRWDCLWRPSRLCKFLMHDALRQAGSDMLQSSIMWHHSLASGLPHTAIIVSCR